MTCDAFSSVIDPFIDGALPAEESAEARLHVESCATCSARVEQRRALSRAVKELPRYTAPDVLRARVRGLATPVPPRAVPSAPVSRRMQRAALAVAAVVLFLVGGRALLERAQGATTSELVLASHLRSLLPGRLIDVQSSDQHNVKPWFNGRVALAPDVPNLDSVGYVLVGGRVDYVGATPVAVVVYRRRQHVINVFSWGAGSSSPPASLERNGYHLIRMERDGVERWIVSDLNREELEDFARRYSSP